MLRRLLRRGNRSMPRNAPSSGARADECDDAPAWDGGRMRERSWPWLQGGGPIPWPRRCTVRVRDDKATGMEVPRRRPAVFPDRKSPRPRARNVPVGAVIAQISRTSAEPLRRHQKRPLRQKPPVSGRAAHKGTSLTCPFSFGWRQDHRNCWSVWRNPWRCRCPPMNPVRCRNRQKHDGGSGRPDGYFARELWPRQATRCPSVRRAIISPTNPQRHCQRRGGGRGASAAAIAA